MLSSHSRFSVNLVAHPEVKQGAHRNSRVLVTFRETILDISFRQRATSTFLSTIRMHWSISQKVKWAKSPWNHLWVCICLYFMLCILVNYCLLTIINYLQVP